MMTTSQFPRSQKFPDKLNMSLEIRIACMRLKEMAGYLREELLGTLIGRLRPYLDRHLSAILQEALVDVSKAAPANYTLEVVGDHL